MNKTLFINLFLCFCPILVFAQMGYKSDTLIYQKQGKPYRLIPMWVSGKSDTFNFSRIELMIESGDTLINKRLTSKIIHQVQNINDTAIFQTAKIGKEIYQQQIYLPNTAPTNPRIKDFYEVVYQTDRDGTNIKILNCTELQKHLIPDLQENIDLLKEKKNKNVYLFSDYPDKMTDCKVVQSFLTQDLVMFHQLYNQLVPVKDTLKYQIRLTDTADTKRQISMYLQISVITKKNGNKIFKISEDKTKGATLSEILTTDLNDMIKKADDNWGVDGETATAYNDEDNTIIELDKFNYPVKIIKRNISTETNTKKLTKDLYEYKIEKISQQK
jgi:hypothetical protein